MTKQWKYPMEETSIGRIEIAPSAIAALVSEAVLESYGVVGMANKNIITT